MTCNAIYKEREIHMGWTSYHANYYYANGTVNRKAECDAYFCEGINSGYYEVIKSQMVGSTYYAAVRQTGKRDLKDSFANEHPIFAVVFLTSVNTSDYYNFSYKSMTEDEGPGQDECPDSILDILSPAENEYATAWRNRCRITNIRKRTIKSLPIGTQICVNIANDNRILTKWLPPHRSTPRWVDWNARLMYSQNQIICYGFTVL